MEGKGGKRMKITVVPKCIVETDSDWFPSKHLLICIVGSGEKETILKPNPNRLGELRLRFDDINSPREGYIHFTKLMAQQILYFVAPFLTGDELKEIIIHCNAGLSRSPGVAAALATILNQDENIFFIHHFPNPFVRKTIIDAANNSKLILRNNS